MSDLSPSYPAILFDLDGTLVLSLKIKMQNAAQLWSETYPPVSPEAVHASYWLHSGLPRQKLFGLIAKETLGRPISHKEYDRLSEKFTQRNIESLRLQPFVDGAQALLSDLYAAGVAMGISSSAEPTEVEGRLKDHPCVSFFQVVMGSHGGFHKGRPHLEHFATLIGRSVSTILMIGDEPNDWELTRGTGAKIALVAQTRPLEDLRILRPDILVHTLPELRPYLL